MTLIEHLDELRSRIIKVGVEFFGVAIVAWFFRERIFDWLLAPAGGALQGKLNVTGVTEQLFTDMANAGTYGCFEYQGISVGWNDVRKRFGPAA